MHKTENEVFSVFRRANCGQASTVFRAITAASAWFRLICPTLFTHLLHEESNMQTSDPADPTAVTCLFYGRRFV